MGTIFKKIYPREEMIKKINEIVSNKGNYEINDLSRETHLKNDIFLDSLDMLDIITEIEEEFELTPIEYTYEKIHTINDLYFMVLIRL